jgi:hypothetical protein
MYHVAVEVPLQGNTFSVAFLLAYWNGAPGSPPESIGGRRYSTVTILFHELSFAMDVVSNRRSMPKEGGKGLRLGERFEFGFTCCLGSGW